METVDQRMVEASRSWSERQGWGAPLAFLGHERQLPGITPSALDDRNGVGRCLSETGSGAAGQKRAPFLPLNGVSRLPESRHYRLNGATAN